MPINFRSPSTKRWLLFIVACILTIQGSSCTDERADAYGNFESTEIVISAEATGRLIVFDINEGQSLAADETIGLIDTLQLSLSRSQLEANMRSVRSKTAGVRAHVAVLEEQRRVATTERDRVNRLLADRAATQKQLDDVEGQIAIIERQIDQARTQLATIRAELDALAAQVAQIDDQIRKSVIVNPVSGTVLTKYSNSHEIVSFGRPLYQLADLSTMELRAYVSGEQLPHVRLGQLVDVKIDDRQTGNRSLPGEITWIASEAEFTPRTIQTKEERVHLVYAVKVRVDNADGTLKIGMPGEVWFRPE